MDKGKQRWILGLIYIVAIAAIWIAASYIVQSVVDAGVSPFLVTYICNSLFMIYIPLAEIGRYFTRSSCYMWIWWKSENDADAQEVSQMEHVNLLPKTDPNTDSKALLSDNEADELPIIDSKIKDLGTKLPNEGTSSATNEELREKVDAKWQWTRTRIAKVSLLICPFWFFAQLAFNLSLKFTTVTVSAHLFSVFFPFCKAHSMFLPPIFFGQRAGNRILTDVLLLHAV